MPAGERHSGRLLLRMPQTLHAELAKAAEREGTSLNQLIVTLLSRSVAGDEARPGGTDGTMEEVDSARRPPRALTAALVVNFAVVLLAGVIAVALLVVAWRGGF